MRLTKEQLKEAKKALKAVGCNYPIGNGEFGNSFWEDECKGSFEGMMEYMISGNHPDGSGMRATILESKNKIASEINRGR